MFYKYVAVQTIYIEFVGALIKEGTHDDWVGRSTRFRVESAWVPGR